MLQSSVLRRSVCERQLEQWEALAVEHVQAGQECPATVEPVRRYPASHVLQSSIFRRSVTGRHVAHREVFVVEHVGAQE